ncbi:tripartite tricarboxylate transporter substrate binding protein [Hydrogenophaga sp.]|uniref:Bug family tripartite tricarboxylate transporter substrate binding protein n=1 Tax=Hydrogenophaga sp. TaxID=1904254 RepID=UPI00271B3D35|nr:tripartite tricarboxylate transporter substrate-binding protein [Hydrogenophaga sp.]MDO9435941.1 tripartite tricarboxylate transporter substrate-binding protein [Hydrogenophaga sp.]
MKTKHLMLSALVAVATCGATAQPVTKFVIGTSPGAGVDNITRLVADSMSTIMKRTIVVENRVGASGNVAAEHVAKALPDGKTVLITYSIHPVIGSLFPNLRFDPIKDFRAVGLIATTPYAIVAHPKLPGTTLKEMLALAKTQGRTLNFASTGLGSPQHLMMERLKQQTGVGMNMVHYKSAAPALTDVVGGHLDFMVASIAFADPQVKAGKIKVLAVTSEERLPQFPDAPTVTQSSYKGFVTDGWFAMLLPAKTPPALVKEYNDALNQALTSPAIREKFQAQLLTPRPGKPEVLDDLIRDEAVKWKQVITSLNIKPE